MSPARRRIESKIDRWGETLEVNGSRQVKAIAQDMAGSLFSTYLTSLEQSQMTRPGLLLLVKAAEPLAPGDLVVRGARQYQVAKTVDQTLAGETLCRLVIGV